MSFDFGAPVENLRTWGTDSEQNPDCDRCGSSDTYFIQSVESHLCESCTEIVTSTLTRGNNARSGSQL